MRIVRSAGHDVLAVSEFQQRSVDEELMELANAQDRILITEDKDFGWRAFIAPMDSPGVILIRFPADARVALADSAAEIVRDYGERLRGAFVVLRPGAVRISDLPFRN